MEMIERVGEIEEVRMQKDYLEAYCCVTRGSENKALEIAARSVCLSSARLDLIVSGWLRLTHPPRPTSGRYAELQHPAWRAMFAAVIAHVKEAQGHAEDEDEEEGDADRARAVAMDRMAKREAMLDLALEDSKMLIEAPANGKPS